MFWSDEYSVGNDEIDRQHEHILALINALEIAASSGEGKSSADLVLAHLWRFLNKHFVSEERLMAAVGYPDLLRHQAEHQDCARQFAELLTRVDSGQMAPVRCAPFVREWLHGHLLGSDQQYAVWLRRQPDAVNRWAEEAKEFMKEPSTAGV